MKKTKIIATIGPVSENEETLREMTKNGLNTIRINMSHAYYDECENRINIVRRINKEQNTNIGILVDTKGPEIRTGKFENGVINLEEGNTVILNNKDTLGNDHEFTVRYEALIKDVKENDKVILNNGLVTLNVINNDGEKLTCIVENTGTIKDKRSVNLPGVVLSMPFLSEKDREDILFAIKMDADFLALSFVSTKEDVLEVRDILDRKKNDHMQIISKIENQRALDNIDEIIEVSDGIMIARGDLGVEVALESLPVIQKELADKCHEKGKICIVATEMLASMEENLRPTRAEVSDVSNAVLSAVDAIMLSGETANGKYPAETVKVMSKIALAAEESMDYHKMLQDSFNSEILDITGTIAYTVAEAANILKPGAIVATTRSGYTAKKVSRFRPSCPIIASSPSERAVRSLALHFGVYGYVVDEFKSTDEVVKSAKELTRTVLGLDTDDKIIITGGIPTGKNKSTNFMKIEEL